MSKFEWTKSERVLTMAVNIGGLGLTPTQVTTIAVQQTLSSYKFEWHGKYHGSKSANYVYIRTDNATKNLPRLWLSGTKARAIEGGENLPSRVANDVRAIANNPNNITLLLTACQNIYPTAF